MVIIIVILKPSSTIGEKAPEFTLTDIDGNTFHLSDYQGQVVVLDLMATWCGACIKEMSHLKELYNRYDSSEVVIMSIDIDTKETNEQLRKFKEDYGDNWIFARDTDGVSEKYDVYYIPEMVIIDKNGQIAYENVGVTTISTLSKEIDKLL
jgi:peroxiredoxin